MDTNCTNTVRFNDYQILCTGHSCVFYTFIQLITKLVC